MPTKVTDPALLQALEGGGTPQPKKVTDPNLLRALEAPAEERDKFSAPTSALAGFVDWSTFGAAPRAYAAIDAVPGLWNGQGYGAAYDDALAQRQAVQKQAYEDNPGWYTMGGIGGGLATAAVTPAVNVAKGATVLGRTANAATNAALQGGVTNAMQTEGPLLQEKTVENAIAGGLTGAIAGGVMTPVVEGAVGATRGMQRYFTRDPQQWAQQKMANVISGVGPDEVAGRLDDLQAQVPDATLADALKNRGARLARTVRTRGGEGAEMMEDYLRTRQQGQPERITGYLKEAAGDPSSYYKTDEAWQAAKEQASRPLYDEFYKTEVPYTPEIQQVLQRVEKVPGVMGRAKTLASIDPKSQAQFVRGEPDAMSKLTGAEAGRRGVPNAQIYSHINTALNDSIENTIRTGDKGTGRAYTSLAKDYRAAVDNALGGPENSVWAKARAAYAGPQQIQDALAEGRDAFKVDHEMVAQTLREMSETQREAYRIGAARQLTEEMGRMSDEGNAIRRIWTSNKQKALRAIFGDEATFQKFAKKIDAEKQLFETYKTTVGGSQTADKASDLGEMGVPEGVTSALRGRYMDAIASVVGKYGRAATGLTEERAAALAKELLGKSMPGAVKSGASAKIEADKWRDLISAILTRSATTATLAEP